MTICRSQEPPHVPNRRTSVIRVTAVVLAALAAGGAWAQASSADVAVGEALARLRTSGDLWVQLSGTDSMDSTVSPVVTDLSWSRRFLPTGQLNVRLDVRSFRNGALAAQTVGDGKTVWRLDVAPNTFAAQLYGTEAGGVPPTYLSTLLQTFTSVSDGPDASLARLVRETYGGSSARFTQWMPACLTPRLLNAGTVNDPNVPGRKFVAGPTVEYAIYSARLPASDRVLAFELGRDAAPQAPNYRLTKVFYSERGPVGNRTRLLEWTVSLSPGTLPGYATFAFTIPPGARPVPIRRPGG